MVYKYREVRGTFTALTPDTTDADTHPNIVPLAGSVVLTPIYKDGGISFSESGHFDQPQPKPAAIDQDGILRSVVTDPVTGAISRQPLFLPVTVDERANQEWTYEASFPEVVRTDTGERVNIPTKQFAVEPGDGPLNLVAVATTRHPGMTITKGAPGAGLLDISAANGEITFSWDNGLTTTIPVPGAVPGPPGKDGVDGVDGAPGADGLPGADGQPGADGADGAPGADGADGLPGAKGDPGDVRFEGIDPGITVRTNDVLIGDTPVPSVAYVNDEVKWSRGTRTAPLDVLTAAPGTYEFPTYRAATGITPPLPTPALGGGTLEIFPGSSYRAVRYTPIGVTETPKSVWQNEYNVGLAEWYGWHRITPEPPPSLRGNEIEVFGDSHSEGAVVGSWDESAGPLINETFVNLARSGDDTTAIGIRIGWVQPLVEVVGGVIPASGSVTLRSTEQITTRENRFLIAAEVEGVVGALTYNSGGEFTFARSAAGDPVEVPGLVRVKSAFAQRAATMLVWMGGNDFNGNFQGSASNIADHVVAGYKRAVEWGESLGKRVIVAGVTNRASGGPGTDQFAQVEEINRRLREEHPGRFIDVQGYYSQQAIYDAGLTPTAADLEAMGGGAIPPQLLLADGVHLTPEAHAAMGAHRIAPWLVARGFATPSGDLPAPTSLVRATTEQRLAALESKVEDLREKYVAGGGDPADLV